ncbi:hypothetical protein D9M73_156580 [compost metagenome]
MVADQREGGCAAVEVVAHLQVVDLGNYAVSRRIDRGVGKVQLRFIELRLGFPHRRVTVGLDVRVAVQGHDGAGDLLFDGGDALPGDLQVGFRALIKGPGHELGGDQGFLAGKFLLVEVRRRFRRLQFSLLLTVAGLEPIDTQPRNIQLRLGTLDCNLQGLGVEAKQHLALADLLIVLDRNLYDLPGNPRIDRGLGHPGVGIVGGDEGLARHVVRITCGGEEGRHPHHQPGPQFFLQVFFDRRLGLMGLRSRDVDGLSHDRMHL